MDRQMIGFVENEYILCPSAEQAVRLRSWVKKFVDKQPRSFDITRWNIDDIMSKINDGILIPWFYVENTEPIGMVLFSILEYKAGVQSIKIEFLSCENFFRETKMYDFLESRAIDFGITFIEAVAHPAIATYAVRRKGFKSDYKYIVKDLTKQRKH